MHLFYMLVYVSMLLSISPTLFFLPAAPTPVSISLLSMSASLFLPCEQVDQCYFSRFHIYTLIYDICFSLTYFTLYNRL